jgi:Ca2+-binding RTX toxin-like protein
MDMLADLAGNDTIRGLAGNDSLLGGFDNDSAFVAAGSPMSPGDPWPTNET